MARLWLSMIPLLGIAVIGAAVWWLMAETGGHAPQREPDTLILWSVPGAQGPIDGTALEHGGGIVDLFERRSGLHVKVHYADATELLRQLQRGGDADLLLLDDARAVGQARAAGLIDDTWPVAAMEPVLMVRYGNPHNISDIRQLAEGELRVAIVESNGSDLARATQTVLEQHQLTPTDLNVTFRGRDATALADAVIRGRADVAILWRSTVILYAGNSTTIAIDDVADARVMLTVGLLVNSPHRDAARRFAGFMAGPVGQDMFARYHFARVDEEMIP